MFSLFWPQKVHYKAKNWNFYVNQLFSGSSSFKNGLSTRWVLVIYPILACTGVASNKRVSSGASFRSKTTSNYSTCELE